MVGFALFGAGRIGRMHAENLAANPRARLVTIYDVAGAVAQEVAEKNGAAVAPDVDAALGTDGVDAVLIASSTDTHVDLITAAAQAGKAILCEKPIDLDIARVNRCRDEIADYGVPVQIGFNPRYDPNHLALREAVRSGAIGKVEQIVITSRDPGPPSLDYLRVSGGLYRDMMIHDFDLARFVLGADEPVEVSAMGSVLVDPAIATVDDIDTAMVVMRTAAGVLCHINCSRRAVYGYDQRLEVFGDAGMVITGNRHPTTVERYTATAAAAKDPVVNFFFERYPEAFEAEINDFIDAVEGGRAPSVTFEDGRRALMLADAATESRKTGRTITVSE